MWHEKCLHDEGARGVMTMCDAMRTRARIRIAPAHPLRIRARARARVCKSRRGGQHKANRALTRRVDSCGRDEQVDMESACRGTRDLC